MEEEFAPESNEDVVDNRPLEVRIGDKNWKTRQTAYDELKKEVSLPEGERSGSVFSDYASWLTKMTADSNASALDSGLDAAIAFVDAAGPGVCQVHYDKLFANVVDKTFSGRASTLAKGKALMHKMIEVDEAGACTAFLLTKLADKKPKIPPTSLDIIKEGIESYGIKAFPVKEVIKALPAVFNGTNSAARDSAMALTVEMYRWIRLAPLQSMLDGLRTAQKSDFDKIIADKGEAFGAVPPEPTVYLRKERPSPEAAAAKAAAQAERAAAGSATTAVVPEGGDGREYVDEVDLLKKLKNTEYATLVAEEKWSEQLKGLQLVIDAIGPVPKIKAGTDVHDIIQTIKGFLRQGHLQLQVSSLKILCLLADGLRKEFGSTLRPIMQQVVHKCKEKRLVVEVQAVLNIAFAHCLAYDVVNDDVIEFVSSKKSPPHGKIGLLEVVVKTFTTLPDKVSSDSLKPLAMVLVVECEDSDPKVREAAALALASIGTLAKSRGRLAADAYKVVSGLENSNAKVFKKVLALMEGGGDSGGAGANLGGSMKSKASDSGSVASTMVKKMSATSNTASTTSLPKASTVSMNATTGTVSVKKAPTTSTATATASTKRPANTSAAANNADDDVAEDITLSLEEAVLALEPMCIPNWTETGLVAMDSSKWQDKVEALTAIENRCGELSSAGTGVYTLALVKYISSTSGNFKISNINILKATIQTCGAVVKSHNGTSGGNSVKFSRAAAWELLKHLGEKLNDKKTKDSVQTLLTALADVTSVAFVLKRMKVVLEKCVSPVAHQYYLEWVKDAISEFGCTSFPVPFVCSFCQLELENKNAAVRTAAVECMGVLYYQVGPRLSAVISDDIKPALKTLLEAEFAKVGHDPSAASKAPRANTAAATSTGGGSAGGGGDSSGGIPRQDLSALLDKNILAELAFTDSKTSWQRRKAAMESIVGACERSAHFLEANKPTGEIVKALKPRMSDTQANLKPLAVTAIAHVVASLDTRTAGAKVLLTMAPAMMIGLADNKKSMRDSTICALQHAVSGTVPAPVEGDNYSAFAAADTSMLMATVPAAVESLANVVGRQELLLWLIHHVPSLKGDCTDLVSPIVLTLQDKNAGVRAAGETLLTQLLAHSLTTKTALDKSTRDLPPATKRGMQACIDRMMAAHGTAPKAAASSAGAGSAGVSNSEPAPVAVASGASVSASSVYVPEVVNAPPTPPRPTTASSAAYNTSPPIAPARTAPVTTTSASVDTPALPPTPAQTRRPVAATPTTTTLPTTTATAPATVSASWLLKRNAVGKLRRMEEFTRLNWPQPPDEPSDTEIAALKVVWRPIVTPDLAFLLFPIVRPGSPVNQDVYVPAMNELSTQLTCPYLTHHTEFLLRWCCIVLCLKHESGPGLLRLLQLVCDLFEAVRVDTENNTLSESEVMCILPHLVDRCGHRSEKHQQLIVYAISLMCELTTPNRVMLHLSHGLHSHNKRSRVVCLGEMHNMILTHSTSVISGSVVHSVVSYLDSKDIDVAARGVCLDVLLVVFNSVNDGAKFKKLVGNDVSERTLSAIEDRINGKTGSAHNTPAPASTAGVNRTPAKAAVSVHHTPATPTITAAPAHTNTHPTIDTTNDDVWAANHGDNAALVSPATEMRTNRIILEQIDSVMASTPLPQHRGSVQGTPEVLVSNVHTPLTTHSTHSHPNTAHTAPNTTTHATTAPDTINTTHTTQSSVVDPDELQDGISALPVEFRSPVSSPAISKYKARVSLSGVKKDDEGTGLSELDGVYLDIEQKVDALLHTAHPVSTSEAVQEECKDYLKMLHSIVNGEWSSEKSTEDDRVLLLHSDALIVRLVGCIERSFNLPCVDSATGSTSIQGVDVSLLAISLSVLFSMVKRAEVSAVLTEDTLFAVFHECLLRICDSRITTLATQSDALGVESKETAQQVARALNNIVLKLGMLGTAGPVLLAMLRVMFCCIPGAELPVYADHKPLPNASTKPASRLVIQILSEHGNKANPYTEPEVALVPLLHAIHHFFTRHPTSTSNDTPFRTVKTVLNEIVLVKGGNSVLATLKTTAIPHTAFIYLLTCRLGNVSMTDTNTDLNAAIVAVIDDITSSRDKLAAIKELHKLKTANPQVDINTYLHKISTAFRRYVLNTLAKLDEGEGGVVGGNVSSSVGSSASIGGNNSTGSNTPVKALLGSVSSPDKAAASASTYTTDTPAPHEYASARSTPATATSVHTTHSLDYSPIDPNTSPVIASTTPYTKAANYSTTPNTATPYSTTPAATTPYTTTTSHTSSTTPSASATYALAHPEDHASEALRILEGIKARPGQITTEAPTGLEGSNRSYSLEYTPRATGTLTNNHTNSASASSARTPTRTATSIDTSPTNLLSTGGSGGGTGDRELSVGKHKRFAYNPETKRMEIVMVSSNSGDASPAHSPTGLMAGDNSPFARRNDIIRNSLSSLTAQLDLPRSTSGEFRSTTGSLNSTTGSAHGTTLNTTSGVAIDEENLEARIQRLLSPKGNRTSLGSSASTGSVASSRDGAASPL